MSEVLALGALAATAFFAAWALIAQRALGQVREERSQYKAAALALEVDLETKESALDAKERTIQSLIRAARRSGADGRAVLAALVDDGLLSETEDRNRNHSGTDVRSGTSSPEASDGNSGVRRRSAGRELLGRLVRESDRLVRERAITVGEGSATMRTEPETGED